MSPQEISEALSDKFMDGGGVDYLATFSFFNVLEKFMSLAVTLFTVYILVLMPIVMVLEVVYIAFPAFRDIGKRLEVKFKGNGFVQSIFGITFRDAKRAIEEANTIKTGKNAMSVYMRIKLWWIFLASCSVYFQIIGSKVLINTILSWVQYLIDMVGMS